MVTRVASSAGPPATRAVTETAMKAPEVPMSMGVAGAYAPETHRLHHRGHAADQEGREHRPGQVRLALSRHPDDDDRGQHDAGNAQGRLL